MKAKYSAPVMSALRQHHGLEEDDTSYDRELERLSRDDVFQIYLEWNGIIGYTRKIKSAIWSIYAVELK